MRSPASATIAAIDEALGRRGVSLAEAVERHQQRRRGTVGTTAARTVACVSERDGRSYELGVRGSGTGIYRSIGGEMLEIETASFLGSRVLDARS